MAIKGTYKFNDGTPDETWTMREGRIEVDTECRDGQIAPYGGIVLLEFVDTVYDKPTIEIIDGTI